MEYRVTARNPLTDNVFRFVYFTQLDEDGIVAKMAETNLEVLEIEQGAFPFQVMEQIDLDTVNIVSNIEELPKFAEDDAFMKVLREGGVADMFNEENSNG